MNSIISTNVGGLANRMKSLASVIRYGKLFNNNYQVYWQTINSYEKHFHLLNCSFEKLFSNNVEVASIKGFDSGEIIRTNLDDGQKTYNSHNLMIAGGDDNKSIDFQYNNIPENIKQEYIESFRVITPITELQEKIDIFSSDNFDPHTVSVHIRSWGRVNEQSRQNFVVRANAFIKKMFGITNSRSVGLFYAKKFEKKMAQYPQKTTFFLSTDTQVVKDYFTQQSPLKNRVIVYCRTTDLDTSRDFPEGVQEDLVELYLLSKNKSFLLSDNSTFSEVAWWLSGCPDDVTIL